MRVIALGHKAQQGKTWGANFLAANLPGHSLVWGIGDGIKVVARATEGMGLRKDAPLLQKIGVAYRADDPYVWIKVWHGVVYDNPYLDTVLVPDLRFKNEARFLREELGATLVKLIRFHPGSTKRWVADDRPAEHVSETDLDHWDEWDHIIEADSTLSLGAQLTATFLAPQAPRLRSVTGPLDLPGTA
jgi:hypothetical protein